MYSIENKSDVIKENDHNVAIIRINVFSTVNYHYSHPRSVILSNSYQSHEHNNNVHQSYPLSQQQAKN